MRSIVHLDADAFFASVEQAADPRLRGKPIAVGGEKRGIIASASYEARKFGIYTPMPSIMARRLCPKLILLPGDFDKYELFSRLMFSYAYDFTPDVEIGSIDEGYFDLTGTRKPPDGIAQTIRQAIRQSLKLSVSEGVGSNKLVSQIASKLRKPYGFEFVPPMYEARFLSPLANKWLPGVGPKTATQLNTAGLAYIGQIARTPADLLGLIVGNQAPQLRNFSLGIDERPVIPVRAPAKSYGEQETFGADTTDEEFLEATLRRMADTLMAKVREDGKSIRTLAVKVRYNDMDEEQASESLPEPTDLETEIYSTTSALLRKAWRRRVSLRLVSLKLSNVYNGIFRGSLALDVSARRHAAEERLAGTVDELRQKYGRVAIQRGHDFTLRAKNGRGHEPTADTNGTIPRRSRAPADGQELENAADSGRPQMVRGEACVSQLKTKIQKLKTALQIVQRQRIGNSFARVTAASIGPELRFRIEANPLPTPHSALPTQSPLRTPHSALRTQYVPLNVHSYYSFLDSTLSTRGIVEFAKRYELPAIALTDKNNLHGAVEFAQLAAAAGIKPIIGAELDWSGQRICLYARNQEGYTNLCRILSSPIGETTSGGTSSTSPCSTSPHSSQKTPSFPGSSNLQFAICNSQFSIPPPGQSLAHFNTTGLLAVSPHAELAEFFPDRFYLEVNNRAAFEKRHPSLPCVATLPIHYELPSDRWKYDIVQSIRTLTLLRQQHLEKRLGGNYHFRPATEMHKRFAAHPELLAHSLEIADRCSFTIAPGKPQFPAYHPPDGSTPAAYLRRLVMDGLRRRYPREHARRKPQLEEELAIILDVGYEEYFLIMWDILQECRRRGIDWITRGSAADSLACYCLEISGVCPIRFDLYFRRFLNKDRMALNKLPDIDVDFPHDRKDDVIELILKRYGPDHAAVVGGFSTFQSRSAFAEIAKVMGVSEFQVRRLTERLPHFSRASELTEVVADTLECRDLPLLNQEPYSTALRMARFLDGFPRYPKMHPCGLVLSRQRMHEITPTFTCAKGYPTTHFDMDSVEAVGLIKMDILAQGGLAVMRDVAEMLHRRADIAVRSNIQTSSGLEQVVDPLVFQSKFPSPLPSPKGRGNSNGQHDPLPTLYARPTPTHEPTPPQEPTSTDGPQFSLSSWERAGVRGTDANGIRTLNCVNSAPSVISPQQPQVTQLSNSSSFRKSSFPSVQPLISICGRPESAGGPSIDNLPSPAGPFADPQVWDLIASGGARAVHHIESPAMISLCKMCNVRDIDTLIAIVSVIRPGAANESKKMEFARRYQGLSPVHYPHPSLELCLRSTYGLVVYEEHILQMCEAFAGLPPGRADILRRALAKEKTDLIDQIQTEFADCARKLGRAEAEIIEVWDLVTGFRGYAFCKAHSTAYGVEAYQSAWIKLHYPAEFMAAVLTNGKGFYDPLVYVLECHRLGIPLLPPCVNQPGPQFTVSEVPRRFRATTDGQESESAADSEQPQIILAEPYISQLKTQNSKLKTASSSPPNFQFSIFNNQFSIHNESPGRARSPLRADAGAHHAAGTGLPALPSPRGIRVPVVLVKRLTTRTKETILRERALGEFSSLTDFFLRVCPLPEEMEALIRVGAFDSFGQTRTAQYWASKSAECDRSAECGVRSAEWEKKAKAQAPNQIANQKSQIANQLWLLSPGDLDRLPSIPLIEPNRLQRLQAEEELLGYPASSHPLELFPDIAWDTYCSINRLGEHIGEQIVTCGLVIEQRLFHQVTGEPMKFLTIADWTGIIETELFARTYQSYGLNTIRYRVLEITATVEPFENNRGHTLRVLRAGKPRVIGGTSSRESPISVSL